MQPTDRHPWIAYVLPMLVFMVVTSFEPAPPADGATAGWIPYRAYPIVYAIKLLATLVAVGLVSRNVLVGRVRNWRLSVAVGMIGSLVWIGLAEWQRAGGWLAQLGLGWLASAGVRSGFNPLVELANRPALAWSFLALRFAGLILVVPVIEELFLRGFVQRFAVRAEWWNVPLGTLTPAALAAITIVPMVMHPQELVAAAIWFPLVTWLCWRTKSLWDCIVAHAVTNTFLGGYVLATNHWHLM